MQQSQPDTLYRIAQRPIENGGWLAAYCSYVRWKAQSSGEMYVSYHGRPQLTGTNIRRGGIISVIKAQEVFFFHH